MSWDDPSPPETIVQGLLALVVLGAVEAAIVGYLSQVDSPIGLGMAGIVGVVGVWSLWGIVNAAAMTVSGAYRLVTRAA